MATHSSVIAWWIPGMGEPGGLPSMGSHRVGHNWSYLAAAAAATMLLGILQCAGQLSKPRPFRHEMSVLPRLGNPALMLQALSWNLFGTLQNYAFFISIPLPHVFSPCWASILSCVRLFVTSWTVACQAPLSMEFSRQKYWSGLLFPSPGDLPNPGIEATSSTLADIFFTTVPLGKLFPLKSGLFSFSLEYQIYCNNLLQTL